MAGVRELQLADLPSRDDPKRGLVAEVVHRLFSPFIRGEPAPPHEAMGFYTDTTVCIGCKACEVACKQWNQLPADGFDWTGNSYDNTGELSATSWRHVKFIEQFPVPAPRNPSPPSPLSHAGERGSQALPRPNEPPSALLPPLPSVGEGGRGGEGEPRRFTLDLMPELVSKPFALDMPPDGPTPGRWLMMSDVCKHCVTAPCQQACPTGALIHNEFENVYVQPDICNGCSYCVASCPFGVIERSDFDGHSHKCTLCFDRQRDGLVPACAKACPTNSILFGPVAELRQRAKERVEELHKRGVPAAHLYGDTATETYSSLNSFYLLIDHPSVYGLPEKPFNPWLNLKGDYLRAIVGGLAALAVLVAALLLGR